MGEIETGIPIPPRRGRPRTEAGIKAAEMNPGDSRLCSPDDAEKLRQALLYLKKKTRTAKEGDYVRVWCA